MAEPAPTDSYRENTDVNSMFGMQSDGLLGIGIKPLDSFALEDSREKTALWTEHSN